MLRALTLQSVAPDGPSPLFPDSSAGSQNERLQRARNSLGYGTPEIQRAVSSSPKRAILTVEETIQSNGVHLFAVPIPDAMFQSSRTARGISISLAFDPPVRSRRLDYLGNRMSFELVRGLSAQQVMDLFVAGAASGESGVAGRVSGLPAANRIKLKPSRTLRTLGANQYGSRVWKSALRDREGLGSEFLLVVQNLQRWSPTDLLQDYAVTVCIWVDEPLPELYEELRLRVEDARLRARALIQV